ncbi:MAG: phytoene/squalene synthase family protein [Planctomycetota bacterium]|nr:phytoene/squalene synthase family protein [Planctomycetota bacterium]
MQTATATREIETAATLDDAYRHCTRVTKECARNFYYGLKLTPEPRRSGLYAMYAWMRTGDDAVDEGGDLAARERELARFRGKSEAILAGESAGDSPMWAAWADTLQRWRIDRDDIRAMLDGLEEDLHHHGYETEAELERYCRRVASSVGSVCVTIWGVRPGVSFEEARRLAVRRGLAFQLTNILRDYAEDFDMDRVYIPRAAFRGFDLTPEDLRAWREPARCASLMRERLRQAREHYVASDGLEKMVDPACAPSLWAMTRIYRGLLEKIEADPRRIAGGPRVRLASIHKAGIALQAVIKSRSLARMPARAGQS